MHLNIASGELELVNAGHPAPLLIREGQVVRQLESATTLPVGLGGELPRSRQHTLQPGDRVLCYSDGIIEERDDCGQPFGEERLIACVNRLDTQPSHGMRADLRRLAHTLKKERRGRTSDDATLFMIEWHGGAADHLAALD
jgi:serine phosphatase RsbU (regulator of sigma subunit)